MNPTRRDVLKAGSALAVTGGMAGCIDGLFESTAADGYTAFFSLWDWAEHIGGDVLSFENPVETGQIGHGWDPDGDLTPDIVSTGLFIYLESEEFGWALDAVETLERDHAEEVALLNAQEGLEPLFLPFDGGDDMPQPTAGHIVSPSDLDFDFELWNPRTHEQLGWWHSTPGEEHWHGGRVTVPVDHTVELGIVMFDTEGDPIDFGTNGGYSIDARLTDGATDSQIEITTTGESLTIHGRASGETGIVIEIYNDGDLIYDTPQDPATVEVVSEPQQADGPTNFDPHTWVDPVLAQSMVENIADGLAADDPSNASIYRDNAQDYIESLQAVHEEFERVIDDATLDMAIFAGHDSFQYLETRYGFELLTPVGVAPDEDVSTEDVAGLIDSIETHGIDTVLFDPFEAARPGEDTPELVGVLRDETDIEVAKPLTPVEGITPEWEDNRWGWVEQMREVNIPALERALNPR